MTSPLTLTYDMCRWLLIPVMAVHNLEEWIMVPRYGGIAPTLQANIAGLPAPPPFPALQIAFLLVTLVPALIVLAAVRADRSRVLDGLVCGVTSMYLASAFLPHLLEFALDRAYAPGLVTAVFVVIPFAIVLLRQALREQYLSGRQLAAAVAAAVVCLPLVLVSTLAISAAIAAALGWTT